MNITDLLIITQGITIIIMIYLGQKLAQQKLTYNDKINFYKRRAEEKEHEANNLRLRINQTINKPYI